MGDSIIDAKVDTDLGKDASGNSKMSDIGLYLKELIPKHFKS